MLLARAGLFTILLCATAISAVPSAEEMNRTLGISLFSDDSLWDDADKEVAKRLGWPEESRTSDQSSFRKYGTDADRVLGARAYSLALYGRDGKPTQLSLVFANKGDFGGLSEITRSLETAIAREKTDLRKRQRASVADFPKALAGDAAEIEKALTTALGNPKPDIFGQSRELKEHVRRWDWQGHAILLAVEKDEYVALRIVPVAVADNRGKDSRIRDTELRQILAGRVTKRANGDVVLVDIPMVDQGPKGFCVPATMERYLRYLGMPADMYILAMAGHTEAGGGTSIPAINAAVTDLVRENLRKMASLSPSLKTSAISHTIDQGLPIIWAILVDETLDEQVTARSKQRIAVTDWQAWEKGLKVSRRVARQINPNRENGHVCMIVGYNALTNELAISDSWGPEFRERWITVEEAEAISQGTLRVITW